MATTTSITTTYAGESKNQWIAAALLTGNTLDKQLISIHQNVKYKEVIHRLATTGGLSNGTCDFSPNGTVTVTERYLTPKELQLNKVLCKKDFRSMWQAIEMGMSAHDVLPKSFADFLIGLEAKGVASAMEIAIWQGLASTNGSIDGFEYLLSLDADLPAAQEVAGTTVTAANVVTEIAKVVDACPDRVKSQEGLAIYVSKNVEQAYIRSLGGFGASGLGANGFNAEGSMWFKGQTLFFEGYPIVVANGMSSNKMIMTTKDNLWFGCGLLSDENEVKVIDMADIDGSQNVRIVMRMTACVNYGVVQDIVTYGITNSAN